VSAVRVVPARPDDAAAISELECRPENRPFVRGLGRPAMAAVCELVLQEWGLARFWLDVFEDNARARHVYEDLGVRATAYAYQPRLPRGDGGTAPLMRMELWAKDRRAPP